MDVPDKTQLYIYVYVWYSISIIDRCRANLVSQQEGHWNLHWNSLLNYPLMGDDLQIPVALLQLSLIDCWGLADIERQVGPQTCQAFHIPHQILLMRLMGIEIWSRNHQVGMLNNFFCSNGGIWLWDIFTRFHMISLSKQEIFDDFIVPMVKNPLEAGSYPVTVSALEMIQRLFEASK